MKKPGVMKPIFLKFPDAGIYALWGQVEMRDDSDLPIQVLYRI